MKDLFIKQDLNDTYENADLDINIKLDNSEACMVKAYLKDKDENLIYEFSNIEAKKEVRFNEIIENVKLWSAENPYLYTLYIELSDKDGNLIEIVPQKIGFRKFELKNKIMHLNGKRIVFRGVNRHEFSCKTWTCYN